MGSINCKEYSTTKNDTPKSETTAKGTAGSYQSKCESSSKASVSNKDATMMQEYTDPVRVCEVSELKEDEMKSYAFDEDTRILLIKQKGQLSAIGNKCPHYGAPLNTGALANGRVRCPWHGACFNIKTGDIEDFPGLDSLPCYNVQVTEDGGVMVRAKRSDLVSNKRLKAMVKRDPKDTRCFIVVGGGPSGAVCVETLRQEGYTGRLVFICREEYLPYDRVKISKAMNAEIGQLQFREAAFYAEYDIEVLLGVSADGLNTKEKILNCSNGYAIQYDKIYIATGSTPFKPIIQDIDDLRNIFTLREYADAVAINEAVTEESNVVCLGSSFIALEAASYLTGKAASVTVIGRDMFPLRTVFGDDIGQAINDLYEGNGVKMIMRSGVVGLRNDASGNITGVTIIDPSPPEDTGTPTEEELAAAPDGPTNEGEVNAVADAPEGGAEDTNPDAAVETIPSAYSQDSSSEPDNMKKHVYTLDLPCDILILGTGSTLNTEFLFGSGVKLNENQSVDVNSFMETNVPDVYVGGDIANAYLGSLGRERVAIGHYQLAQYHGRVAAINMCGIPKKLEAVPFFFTMLFGKGIRYAGHGSYTQVVIDGDISQFKFVAYYVNSSNSVVAVASCGRDPIVAQYAELLSQGKCLTLDHINNDENRQAWTAMLRIQNDEY